MSERPLRAVSPLEPSRVAERAQGLAVRALSWMGRLALKPWLAGVEVEGREHLGAGPRLVLMNHASALDPFLLSLYAGRPLHFLITEPAVFDSPVARMIAAMGHVPKRKLENDTRSVRLLKKWCEVGGAAALFPEGRFPWDGRLLPLQPGLLHLVHYLDVPVVTVRQINGDRFWPAWAPHPRRTTIRLEIDPPVRFEPGAKVAEEVADRLRVDPDRCQRFPVRGKNLASGLARFLCLCPSCAQPGELEERGDDLHCARCLRSWQVGSDNHLRGGGEVFDVGEALRRVCDHLERRWDGTPRCQSAGAVTVMDATDATWKPLSRSTLELDGTRLSAGAWSIDVGEIVAHTLDRGEILLLRTRRKRLAVAMPHDSRAVWTFAIDYARDAAMKPEPERLRAAGR